MASLRGTETSPSSGVSSPTTRRERVVLPAPFAPTRPPFSRGLSWKEASMNRTWRPYCLPRWEKEIKGLSRAADEAEQGLGREDLRDDGLDRDLVRSLVLRSRARLAVHVDDH